MTYSKTVSCSKTYLGVVVFIASVITLLSASLFFSNATSAAQYISVESPAITPQTFAQGTISRITISARATSVYGISAVSAKILRNPPPDRNGRQVLLATVQLSRVIGEQRSGEFDVKSLSAGNYTVIVTARVNRRGADNSASSVGTFDITPPPPPPTLEFRVTDPKSTVSSENGKSIESVIVSAGGEAKLSWIGSEGTKDCGLINRREQTALGKPWSYGQIQQGELVSADGYGFRGKTGSLLANPKTYAVEYSLRCWNSANQYSDTKIVRITANQKPTIPEFKNFKNQTGPQALDVTQDFTFDVFGDPSTGKPILVGTCASFGNVELNQMITSSSSPYKRTYKVSIVPTRTKLDCHMRATSDYGPTTFAFSVVAYKRPIVEFLANNIAENVSMTLDNGEKVKLSWMVYSDASPFSIKLQEEENDIIKGRVTTTTTHRGYKDVAPTKQTTYTLTATDRYGTTQTVSRTVFVVTKIQQYRADVCNIPDPQCVEKNSLENKSKLPTRQQSGGLVVGIPTGLAAAGTCAMTIGPGCVGFGAAIGGGVLSWLTAPVAGLACALGCGAAGGYVGYQAGSVIGSSSVFEPDPKKGCPLTCPPGYMEVTAMPPPVLEKEVKLTPIDPQTLQRNIVTYPIVDPVELLVTPRNPRPEDILRAKNGVLYEIYGLEVYEPTQEDRACEGFSKGQLDNPIIRLKDNVCPLSTLANMPLYHQFDPRWANKRYAGDLFKKNGCGASSMAMVMDYWMRTLAGTPNQAYITPDMTANAITAAEIDENNIFGPDRGTYIVYNKSDLTVDRATYTSPNVYKSFNTPFAGEVLTTKHYSKLTEEDRNQLVKKIITYLTASPPRPIIAGFSGKYFAPQRMFASDYEFQRCTPAVPFASSGHAIVLTGYYKDASGEGIFTMNDPGGRGAHCFYRYLEGRRVVEQWYSEAPESEVRKWLHNAYYVHPKSVN